MSTGVADRVAAVITEPGPRRRAAATCGIALVVFAAAHCAYAGVLLAGPAAFDGLAGALRRHPAVRGLEVALAACVALHLVLGVGEVAAERRRPPAERRLRRDRWLIATGLWLAGYLVWHLSVYRLGIHPDAHGALDFHGTVTAALSRPGPALTTLITAGVLGGHVGLGLRASLDAWHPPTGRAPWRTAAAWSVGLGLAAGYGAVPILVLLG